MEIKKTPKADLENKKIDLDAYWLCYCAGFYVYSI